MNSSNPTGSASSGQPAVAGRQVLRVSLVGDDGDELWRVDNYAQTGLFLSRSSTATAAPNPGPVQLEWIDQSSRCVLRCSARIDDVGPSGIRISLAQANPELISLLDRSKAARRSVATPARPDPSVSELNADELCKAITGLIRTHFEHQLDEVLDAADQALAKRGENDGSNLSDGLYAREARTILSQQRQPLLRAFVDDLVKPFEGKALSSSTESPRAPQLRLVDDNELHLWLIRSESASRLESEVRGALTDLAQRLQILGEQVPTISASALEPEHVLNALIRTFKLVDLDYGLRDFIMRLCGHPELLELGKFYRRVLNALGRLGLGARVEAPAQSLAAPADAKPGIGGQAHTGVASPQPASAAPAGSATPARRPAPAQPAPAQAVAATHRLWQLAQPKIDMRSDSRPVASDADLIKAAAGFANERSASEALENFAASIRAQAARLGAQGVRMEPRQAEAVDLLGRLDEALHLDPLLPGAFRGWSRQLFPALLGTQLGGEDLGAQGDLVRRLFSLLEFGSVLCEARQDSKTQAIGEQITAVVKALAQHDRLTTTDIEQACQSLEQLLQRQRSAGAAVEERVVEACQGQQRLDEARHQVAKELGALFGGRTIPEALAHLLDENLQAAMVLSLLRGGEGGKEWRADMALLEDIDSALHDAERGLPVDDADRLADRLTARLSAVPSDLPRQQKLIADLADAFAGSPLASVVYRPETDASKVRQILQSLDDPQAKSVSDKLDLLRSGDWVAFGSAEEEPKLLKLAWRSSHGNRFVFVNQLGRKAEDLTRSDLISLIRSARARILDEGSASIIERAWRRMLEGMHDELAQRATHDGLTGLLNRKELDRRLEAWLHQRDRRPLALFWLGVDRLRLTNQSLGMAAGDQILLTVAKAIEEKSKALEAAATRIAGDEFMLVVEELDETRALALGKALVENIAAQELEFNGRRMQPSVSVGIVIPASDCVDPGQMLADAESACRAAKEMGRGRVYLHQKDDLRLQQMRETATWVERVETALRENDLLLYAQRAESLSDAARSQPDYLEVLLRMRGAEGVHTPEQFIIAAERYGQIAAVDRFVVRQLIDLLGSTDLRRANVAFNLSSRNIIDEEFVSWLTRQLAGQDFPLQRISVELTETAAIAQLAEAQRGIKLLSKAGIATVLDDFGSGFSSYRYLKHLPVDMVKVDGAFIRDIATSPEDLALAKSINEIAHLLGKLTVAEHVEDQATLDLVREIGFDYAQGFFIAEPQPLLQAYEALELEER